MENKNYYSPFYKDKLYHIFNSSTDGRNIFLRDGNYYFFLRQYIKHTGNLVDTLAYCLLPDHLHFLIRVNDPELANAYLNKFFTAYSNSFNEHERQEGKLCFQQKFKRKLIENMDHLTAAIYFIHVNPVHHGITESVMNYKFSSYRILLGEGSTKLNRNEILEWFCGKRNFINYHRDINKKLYSDDLMIEER